MLPSEYAAQQERDYPNLTPFAIAIRTFSVFDEADRQGVEVSYETLADLHNGIAMRATSENEQVEAFVEVMNDAHKQLDNPGGPSPEEMGETVTRLINRLVVLAGERIRVTSKWSEERESKD